MLAQLKTVVLFEEAIKLAFFRLVEYLEHQHLWVRLQAQNGQKQKHFLLKLVSLFLFWEMKAIPCKKLPRIWRSFTTLCTTPFTEQLKLALTRIERVGDPGAQLSKTTNTLESLVWDGMLRDAVLLCRVAKKKPYLRLANLKKRFRRAQDHKTLDRGTPTRRPATRSRLFTVEVEAGVLRVLFNEVASWGQDTLMYLSSFSVVHRSHPLLFLFWLKPVCSVSSLK